LFTVIAYFSNFVFAKIFTEINVGLKGRGDNITPDKKVQELVKIVWF